MVTRRNVLLQGAAALASVSALSASPASSAELATLRGAGRKSTWGSGALSSQAGALVVPDGEVLPWRLIDGVKTFHLIAEAVQHEVAPGLVLKCLGYNGRTPGPVIEAVEGDRVRIFVTNHLSAGTTVHWHGILLPFGMDGVSGLTQRPIPPGETWVYEFELRQHGTFMYHPHYDEMTQLGLGMMGMFVVHPKTPEPNPPDRDFCLMLSEWAVKPGTSRPNMIEMTDFNVLTFNGKSYPGTSPLVVSKGQRVRIRFGNLSSMDHHPVHLHGYQFRVVATDGGQIPEAGQWPETTVIVPTGSTRVIEFVADAEGDWPMHCHMVHHMMNQMGHGLRSPFGIDAQGLDEKVTKLLPDYMTMGQDGMGEMAEMEMPVPENSIPMVGRAGPKSYIDMGGMFTLLKVRAGLSSYEDPGWYQPPPQTEARKATPEELDQLRRGS